ncbi:GNAT family N-acetyltransferase [Ostreiculturibacter nitratireducens]|uniref:GNAT family N-acetyltransferase n=1 Tax=Ostreiculturibacter nitratireducens TaxID=3075226 RepID=UPI0031B64F78
MTLPFDIPVLETERLRLRGPAESDLAAIRAFGQSERTKFIGGKTDEFGAWRILAAGIGHWALRGYGLWSVDRKADETFVGRVGVIYPAGWPEPELAWHLFDGFEGKGYAHEAALAARAHASQAWGMGPLISLVHEDNDRSNALARRLGATIERTEDHDGQNIHVYRHPEPEAV